MKVAESGTPSVPKVTIWLYRYSSQPVYTRRQQPAPFLTPQHPSPEVPIRLYGVAGAPFNFNSED